MALKILETIALSVVRGILNSHIKHFTPEQLQQAINDDANLWGATTDDIRNKITALKNRFRNHFEKFQNQITTPLLVEYLWQDQRPLCYVIVANPQNYKWFEKQVKTFLDQIKAM